jgi:hypothetical protein
MNARRTKRSRIVLAAAVVLAACGGSLLAASNMGFKLFKPVVFAGTGQIGNMWTSVPFFSPYPTAGALCAKLGL